MDSDEPMVEPRRQDHWVQQRLLFIRLHETLHLSLNLFRRGVFQQGSVRTTDMIGLTLPLSVKKHRMYGSTELVPGYVRRLAPRNNCVQLSHSVRREGSFSAG